MRDLLAYSDQISARNGEMINFKVSSDNPGEFQFQVVHIRCGDDSPEGPGLKQTPVSEPVSYPARYQKTQVGSFIRINHLKPLVSSGFSLQVKIWPTLLGRTEQAIMGAWSNKDKAGFCLFINKQGNIVFRLGDGKGNVESVMTDRPLLERNWYLVSAIYDAETKMIHLVRKPLSVYPEIGRNSEQGDISVDEGVFSNVCQLQYDSERPFLIAGWNDLDNEGDAVVTGLFNGKIDSPKVYAQAVSTAYLQRWDVAELPDSEKIPAVASWDFSQCISGDEILDVSGNDYHGKTENLPTRAMTGWNHDASEMNWMHKPAHYGAIHFHEDDLYDCKWETDVAWEVPNSLRSGTYAAYLTQGEHWFYVPFYVLPAPGKKKNRLCLLISTASYYAYVNNQIPLTWGSLYEHSSTVFTTIGETDRHLKTHPEHGLSMYDFHSDGSGVCYASRLRPFLRMGPRDELWQYNADTHITDWLEELGMEFDVITDDELNQYGAEILNDYVCVMTTTHPEYYSQSMMRGLLDYQQQGGRFIYLGGNGFYWRVAYHPTLPGVIEMRRAEDGMRSWIAQPGEYYMSFTGELSGLWQRNGIPPEAVCGVGFCAQGFNFAKPYYRTQTSFDPRVEWIFKDIDPSQPIGDFGTVFGGAAGSEIDSIDYEMGTPPHALVIAESTDFGADFHWVNESFHHTHSAVNGENCPYVRSDMVFYETPNNGAVFSVGSIAFAGSLAHHNYDNNVSRLLKNVVTGFLSGW